MTRKNAPPAKPAAKKPAKTSAKASGKTSPKASSAPPLLPKTRAFIAEYLKDLNGTAAYRRLHPKCSVGTASTEAWRTLRSPQVRDAIEAERRRLQGVSGMTVEELLADLVAIVRADPAELSQVRIVACSGCWPGEARGAWTEPDPACPACEGEGEPRTYFADTRKLSPGARPLFAGVKATKDGMQVLTESKDAAREKIAKILGAYAKDHELKVDVTEPPSPLEAARRIAFAMVLGLKAKQAQDASEKAGLEPHSRS